MDQNQVFGRKNNVEGQWNAGKCINGEPGVRELLPDYDLGTCTKIGSRNVVRDEGDMHRVFGAPTVRVDIPKKKLKSVADH